MTTVRELRRREREAEQQRRRREEGEHIRRIAAEAVQQPPQNERDRAVDDQRVMTIREWCKVNGFSWDTGKRLIKDGKGPVITQISDRRIGVSVANNRRWQQSRERPSCPAALISEEQKK